MDKIELSRDHHVIGHFRQKSIVIRDTRDQQEHDAKNHLTIPSQSPSSEESVAEIHQLKNNRPKPIDTEVLIW